MAGIEANADCLLKRKFVTISWHTEICFELVCADVKEETAFWFHGKLLFAERSNTQHARVKIKTVIGTSSCM